MSQNDLWMRSSPILAQRCRILRCIPMLPWGSLKTITQIEPTTDSAPDGHLNFPMRRRGSRLTKFNRSPNVSQNYSAGRVACHVGNKGRLFRPHMRKRSSIAYQSGKSTASDQRWIKNVETVRNQALIVPYQNKSDSSCIYNTLVEHMSSEWKRGKD